MSDAPQEQVVTSTASAAAISDSVSATSITIIWPSTTGVDLATFTLFPKLPVELRLKIWRHTLPREVIYRAMRKRIPECTRIAVKEWDPADISIAIRLKHITLAKCLRICQESRSEGFKNLTVFRSVNVSDSGWERSESYFILLRDIIFLHGIHEGDDHSTWCCSEFASGHLRYQVAINCTLVQRLAITTSVLVRIMDCPSFAKGMKSLESLKELILVEVNMLEAAMSGGAISKEGLSTSIDRLNEVEAAESIEAKKAIRMRHMKVRDKQLDEFVKKIKAKMGGDLASWVLPKISLVSEKYLLGQSPDSASEREHFFADELQD